MSISSADNPSAALRTLALIEAIATADGPLTLGQVVAATALPKPTAHRMLTLLDGAGMVVREPDGKRYSCGKRMHRLALDILSHASWRTSRHAILQGLVDEIGETCNLTVLDGAEVVYLDRVETAWPLRLHFQTGSRVPAHCSASGKLLLALLAARERKRIVKALALEPYTANTITRRDAFEAALSSIRRERLSTDDEEFLDGTVCVAVPVENAARRLPVALAVHAPRTRMDITQALAKVPALRRVAAQLADTFA